MQCVYCKEELRDGATVCHACTRGQPLSPDAREKRLNVLLALGAGAAVVLGLAYLSWENQHREAVIENLAVIARTCGHPEMNKVMVQFEIDQMRENQFRRCSSVSTWDRVHWTGIPVRCARGPMRLDDLGDCGVGLIKTLRPKIVRS